MLIHTTRFGTIEVDSDRILSFKDGLLGFPEHHRFALIQTATDPVFFWMQCVDDPALAFVVCDPTTFVADYEVPVRKDDLSSLGLEGIGESQVLVIVNKVESDLTANLLGPIVVSSKTLEGRQLVLSDRRYGTRHRLVRATDRNIVAKTA